MSQAKPLVSVVMPVYNAGRFLLPAVRSILSQTLTDIELIAVDDGSTDDSREILKELASSDSRVRVLNQENSGVSSARNLGIAESSADLVAVCDNDDLSHPDRLRAQADFLARHSEFVAVGCGIRVVSPEGRVLRLDPIERWGEAAKRSAFEGRFDVAGPTLMIRRAALEALGGYRVPFRTADDFDLVLRMIDAGMRLDNVPDRLYDYVVHSQQLSNRRGAEQRLEVVFAELSRELRRRGLEDPLDRSTSLVEFEIPHYLPIDVRARLHALMHIATHLSQVHVTGGESSDSEHSEALKQLRRKMSRKSWLSSVMVGIHRQRYHEARSRHRWLSALRAGLDLWLARRKRDSTSDDLFLPRQQHPSAD
jgi:glycosyltransferase involved in cell wall biosynthesis